MSQTLELNSMNDVLSDYRLHTYKVNRYPKLNSRQRKEKNKVISLANRFLRWANNCLIPNDFLPHSDRVVDRIAYSEAIKYF